MLNEGFKTYFYERHHALIWRGLNLNTNLNWLQWRNRLAHGTYRQSNEKCRGCEFEPHLEQVILFKASSIQKKQTLYYLWHMPRTIADSMQLPRSDILLQYFLSSPHFTITNKWWIKLFFFKLTVTFKVMDTPDTMSIYFLQWHSFRYKNFI